MYQGGVAILTRECLQRRVKQIEHVRRRALGNALATKHADAPIAMCAAYAPKMGYAVAEKRHWNLANGRNKQVPTANLCVWCSDEGWKLGSRDGNYPWVSRILGMNNVKRTTDPGNGKHQLDICAQNDLIPMTHGEGNPEKA